MRRLGILLVVLLLLPGCTGDDDPVPSAEEQADLFVYASERLPDELLEEAAPAGFEVKQIVRHGPDRTASPWVTVGARMEGPVVKSRAIFYVHADAAAAEELFERQVEITERRYESEVDFKPKFAKTFPPPFDVASDKGTGRCGPRFDGLIWCHAQKGRLYLLVQTGTEIPGQPPVKDGQVEAARMVTAAYMKLL